MSKNSLIYFICPITFLKETRRNKSSQALMLHEDIKSLGPLEPKNQAKLHLSWKKSIKMVLCSIIPRPSSVIMDQNLKTKRQSCLKNTMLRFEGQQRNI